MFISNRYILCIGSIYADYKDEAYYFEIIDLLRRLLLSGGLILMGSDSVGQIFLGIVVCAFWLVILVHLKPYKSEWDKVSRSVFRSSDTLEPIATIITRALIKTDKAVLIGHKQDLLKILYKEDVNIKPKQLLKYDSACFNDLSKKDQRKLKKIIEDTILN